MSNEVVVLVRGISRTHRFDKEPVEGRSGCPVQYDLVKVWQATRAEVVVAFRLEVCVGELPVACQLVRVRRARPVSEEEVPLPRLIARQMRLDW